MVSKYSTYVVEDLNTREWLHVGKQKGTSRSEPLIQAINGEYPHKFHNKNFLMFLYSKTRKTELKLIEDFNTDETAKAGERKLKLDPRAARAYGKLTNNELSRMELIKLSMKFQDPVSIFFIDQACLHGDVFSKVRTPYSILSKELKCLFKI